MGAAVLGTPGGVAGLSAAAVTDPMDAVRLPPLRDDLHLLPGPPGPDGSPCWTIHDPARNRYFRIGHAAFEIIARWHLCAPRAIAAAVAEETVLEPDADDVYELYRFLSANNLTQTVDTDYLARQVAMRRTSWWMWLLHNYLFFRIPLVRPDAFLNATVRFVAPFYSAAWCWAVLGAGLLGLVLAMRQWDAFRHTFLHFFSLEGMALYGVTLVVTKTLHELGHAYTAKRYGCRVPTMGVAFLVMWPVLYTDTSDAWKLVSRRARLGIASAGILAELGLAAFATLAWSFLPDGALRSAAFFVATVSWVTTLTINLSPFMRFDGYYLLADALDVPNLQDRAFALARWRLREWLFGLGEEVPERFAPWMHRTLLVYAFTTWIYRLILFLGIAALVYHVFIKVLGILLFAVEIGWFLMRPLFKEIVAWWTLRHGMGLNRNTLATLCGLGGLLWLVLTPVAGSVAVPAVWRAEAFSTLFAPVPARMADVLVQPGQRVAAGDLLFRLEAPEVENKLAQADLRIAMAQERIDRLSAAREGLDRIRVMEEDLAAALAERQGLLDSKARLEVRAPLAGTVVDIADGLRPGRWVNPKLPLAQLVGDGAGEFVGYVAEEDLARVAPGAVARFHPDDPLRPRVEARVTAVDHVGVAALDVPALASLNGGPVAVDGQPGVPTTRQNLAPVDAVYRVTLAPLDPAQAGPAHQTRGVARVDAEARSLLGRFWRTALAVLIREAGF
ncbi:HlyD family efflux transporter periplasmic adaptor subunit [Azospirillum rugosum]|uniref:Peptide zinc metalloprotease protein n=1 Tax=Azospirillum rugosum TaxID=416170 RepID=A0ABS4SG47_9PROT|nr:HlyD family efflux transporter periplasmic adaptor subunit [Azospirillum rugosum]MBP2291536.1 putative peptide zinc metalloprotease protein [Azospirillum rugosum]MDQ0525324.1 putative peptide zinc metalloprotease protein [Azospirillum rugosum]